MRTLVSAVVLSAALPPLAAQAAWSMLYPAQSPPAMSTALMVHMDSFGTTLLWRMKPDDFWQWDGTNWQPVTFTLGPSVRDTSAMVWDADRQRIVLFGGSYNVGGPTLLYQDTWEYDPAQQAWQGRLPATMPPARWGHGMAFDRRRGVTVVFGGAAQSGLVNDTWEWDGTNWTSCAPTTPPQARANAVLAFDPSTQNVLLFGGSDGNPHSFGDTWLYDGSAWTHQQPANPPFLRESTSLTTDLDRRRVLLYGGSTTDPFAWEWDGGNWNLHAIASPGARTGGPLAYDTDRGETLYFGGNEQMLMNDTWVFRTPSHAGADSHESGCPGSAGTPALAHAQYSLPWTGDDFTVQLTAIPTDTAVVLVTGLDTTPAMDLGAFGMPGCASFITTDVATFGLANGDVASWTMTVPNDPALAGAHVYQQALVIDPLAAGGATVSNYVDVQVGIR
jgi:hypothetical protein